MPDISLLQHEYGTIKKESKTSSMVLPIAIGIFMLTVGAYIGLRFYNNFLTDRLEVISNDIAKLQTGSVTGVIKQLEIFSKKAKTLTNLRENHRYPSRILGTLERVTHPQVFFYDGRFDLIDNTAQIDGIAYNTFVLARQVDILTQANDLISDFTISDVGYGDDRAVQFRLNLHFP